MKQVMHDLKKIHNLKHAYIHQENKESISTFDVEKTPLIKTSIELVEQYFMAAQGIDKSYNEITFPLENGDNLIAFLMDETTLVVLLTEEKINLPMLHLALTVIIKKLNNGTYQKQVTRATTPASSPQTTSDPTITQQPSETITPKTEIPNATTPPTPEPPLAQKTPKPTPPPTAEKKAVMPKLKSIFSNPFSAKKSKSKERPYSNTQASPKDKKLVYRE